MAVIKLSNNIQSLFSSTIHLCTYKRTVEELIYNALDAESTSIAIRIHIQENKIQVVDNGNGILQEDFNLLGQRYATSKFVDMPQFKSAPRTYGYRGQALASIIDISKSVKIVSRAKNTEETWTKTFYMGKEKDLSKSTMRPSKGTTMEINGFLYNLKIQNKAIDQFNELSDIKSLLEQLSLVHCNVSFSLRDNSKNEIVLQLHKNRDIYQTLKSLYDIDKSDFQEFQVEKGEYKAKAYISKKYNGLNRHQMLFLNKKAANNTKINKMFQDKIKKIVPATKTRKFKSKVSDEKESIKNHNSFYFVFITCPYYDYEISNTPKQSTLEFKRWSAINKLLDKLVKFYAGDLKVSEIKMCENTNVLPTEDRDDTREKVKQIIKKFLGSCSKKPGVSQMQNGVKGNIIKRKKLKGTNIQKMSPCRLKSNAQQRIDDDIITIKQKNVKENTKKAKPRVHQNNSKLQSNNIDKKRRTHDMRKSKQQTLSKNIKKTTKRNKVRQSKDLLIAAFEKQTDTVTNRCNLLNKEVENYISLNKNKRKQRIFVNETVSYSNVIKNNENITIRNRVQETIIHDYIPLSPLNYRYEDNNGFNRKYVKTSYDLVKTIMEHENTPISPKSKELENLNEKDYQLLSPTTFESHHYPKFSNNFENKGYAFHGNVSQHNFNIRQRHFMSKKSIDNFVEAKKCHQSKGPSPSASTRKKLKCNFYHKIYNKPKPNRIQLKRIATLNFLNTSNATFRTFDLPEYCGFNVPYDNLLVDDRTSDDVMIYDESPVAITITSDLGYTYTLTQSNFIDYNKDLLPNSKYDTNTAKNCTQESTFCYSNIEDKLDTTKCHKEPVNIIFVSNSKTATLEENDNNNTCIEPINICEAVLNDAYHSEHNLTSSEYFGSESFKGQDRVALETKSGNNKMTNNPTSEKEIENFKNQDKNNVMENLNNAEEQNASNNIDVNNEILQEVTVVDNFNMRIRPRFLPKGLSPLFKNNVISKTNNIMDLNFNNHCFEEETYNRFMDIVQMRTEIFEPQIECVRNALSKAIDKFNIELNQGTSSLTFNTQSLTEAKVLGQVDGKFIATIMTGGSVSTNYLVLFDQHAVHERIRLEDNLADYQVGNAWKIVQLEDVVLKLSKDEILHLHNYQDKFSLFGLHWTVVNNQEIILHAIPEAILGKNPRQVEKVISAVRDLILEQIEIIKAQKGCANLYAKSIMDLVFSEACRYAIMFGDSLSKSDCSELIRSLSKCKTPFQCAHGRPVMAVIMEIKFESRKYAINLESLRNFIKIKK